MNAIAVALWNNRFDGGTFHPLSGRAAKVRGDYAVGGVCASLILSEDVSEAEFTASLDNWLGNTLPARHVYVGVWFDTDSKQIFIDGTDIISNLDNALAVAERRGELAIWDFANACEIRLQRAA